MNREERRALKKKGIEVKSEPTYMMKASEIGKAAVNVGKDQMLHEIDQQILEKDKEYQLDIDTMVLWSLNQFTGWGPKKLRDFYIFMMNEHLRMREFYELDDLYPERHKLKEKGVDIEAWYSEFFDEEGNFKKR